MENEVCCECAFYVEAPAGRHGFCKVAPPVFTGRDEDGYPRFYNPTVSPNSFCREWEER